MITASVSSFLLPVKSSLSQAGRTSSGWTQTSRTPASAAIWSSTPHRCPVGSQATPPEQSRRRGPGQPPLDRFPQLPRLSLHRAAGHHPGILVAQRAHLLVSGEIEREHRGLPGDDRAEPRELVIATTVSTREPTTVGHASS